MDTTTSPRLGAVVRRTIEAHLHLGPAGSSQAGSLRGEAAGEKQGAQSWKGA